MAPYCSTSFTVYFLSLSFQLQVTDISASSSVTGSQSHSEKLPKSHSGTKHGQNQTKFGVPMTQKRNRTASALQNCVSLRKVPTTWFQHNEEGPPLTYKTEVNVLFWLVVVLGFVVRFWKLDFPHYTV